MIKLRKKKGKKRREKIARQNIFLCVNPDN